MKYFVERSIGEKHGYLIILEMQNLNKARTGWQKDSKSAEKQKEISQDTRKQFDDLSEEKETAASQHNKKKLYDTTRSVDQVQDNQLPIQRFKRLSNQLQKGYRTHCLGMVEDYSSGGRQNAWPRAEGIREVLSVACAPKQPRQASVQIRYTIEMQQGVSKLMKFPHGRKILKCRHRNSESGNPNPKSMRLLDVCANEARKETQFPQNRYYRYFLPLVWYSWQIFITTSFVKFYSKYNSLLCPLTCCLE